MFCANCGAQVAEGAVFCPNCGAKQNAAPAPAAPVYEAPAQQAPVYEAPRQTYQAPAYQPNVASANAPVRFVGFGEAIKLFFTQYATFSGRATRAEFWWAMLMYGIGSCIPILGYIWALGTFIPFLALSWRRLHDIGKKGSYYFMGLIPIVGAILLIIAYCKESDADNQYGPRKI